MKSCLAAFAKNLGGLAVYDPWRLCDDAAAVIMGMIERLPEGYRITDGVAIHVSARVEPYAVLKAPCLIGPDCFVASHSYLRDGVYLQQAVRIGPSCEIKASFLLAGSVAAHLNYVGNSILGAAVNLEAGAVLANHHNDRLDKRVFCRLDGQRIDTGVEKFGSLLGDGCKVGANAVLSPGTILPPGSIVPRLTLLDQDT